MKFSKLLFVALIAGCVNMQVSALKVGPPGSNLEASAGPRFVVRSTRPVGTGPLSADLGESVGFNVMPPAGDYMPFNHFLDQVSKKVNELKRYIKEQQVVWTTKFTSEEARRNSINKRTAIIKEKIEEIKNELSYAQEVGML